MNDESLDIDLDRKLRSTRVLARKRHECWGCGRSIRGGTRHLVGTFPARRLRIGMPTERTVATLRLCASCAPEAST